MIINLKENEVLYLKDVVNAFLPHSRSPLSKGILEKLDKPVHLEQLSVEHAYSPSDSFRSDSDILYELARDLAMHIAKSKQVCIHTFDNPITQEKHTKLTTFIIKTQ